MPALARPDCSAFEHGSKRLTSPRPDMARAPDGSRDLMIIGAKVARVAVDHAAELR